MPIIHKSHNATGMLVSFSSDDKAPEHIPLCLLRYADTDDGLFPEMKQSTEGWGLS